MPRIRIAASADIPASATVVYGLIADYKVGHPSILPKPYFEDLLVLEGGRGAGTRIRFTMRAFGTRQTSHARITEPDPGHVLVETVEEKPIVTTFTVAPGHDGGSRVTITTEYHRAGILGWVEAFMAPRYLRKVYVAELQQLARVALRQGR